MIKVECKQLSKSNGISYPCLMVFDSGAVVIASDKDNGIFIRGSLNWNVGEVIDDISSYGDSVSYFHGSITLTQE